MKPRALLNHFVLAAVSIGAVSARLQPPVSPPQLPGPETQLAPSEFNLYKRAHTLIDLTLHPIRDCPYLHKLRLAGSQDQLSMILERVGQTGSILLHDFPQVSCDEEVISESYQGRVHDAEHRRFRYIVIPHPEDAVPTFEEYRTDLNETPLDHKSLRYLPLITYNFASTSLYLSPADQHDNRFRYLGIQTIRDRECHVVGFAQDPEKVRRVNTFHFQGRSGVLLLQGLAWIDSQTFQVLRIETRLLAPRVDIGLSNQISRVDFYPVQPSGSEKVLWLPWDVMVYVNCRGIQAHNSHHYSNFKLFRAESTIKLGR